MSGSLAFERRPRAALAADPLDGRLRRVVAEHLGVDVAELVPETSLTDELGMDSLDLLELGLALEDDLGVSLPDRLLERVRTYGDLVRITIASAHRYRAVQARRLVYPLLVRTRITPGDVRRSGALERNEFLTPYVAETIVEDALRAGPGARLDVFTPPDCGAADEASIEAVFDGLRLRGIEVAIHRRRAEAARLDGGRAA